MIESNLVRGYRLLGHNDKVKSLAFHSNGLLLASGSKDKTVRVWDIKNHSSIVFEGHQDDGWFPSVNCVAFHPNKNLVASASKDKTLKLWNLKEKECLASIAHQNKVYSVAISPDNQTIVAGCGCGEIYLYSFESLVKNKL